MLARTSRRTWIHSRGLFQRHITLFSSANETDSTTDGPISPLTADRSIQIMRQTIALENERLGPLNKRILGPLERRGGDDDHLTSLPFVFVLGNHSSGKSTFINHVIGRTVQETGVAPTDDGFTIIAPGGEDVDQDGPALVGNPDMGFSGLRSFGPSLIQRTQLKVRSDIGINFMLVDSPGMIDSPTSHTVNASEIEGDRKNRIYGQSEMSDRGYDFPQVMRWYAERADVILLFFDPDKPGTTGETLSTLTSSLVGMDHKLHIVLNKVDQFQKIHDFARAYGSLCWNLSKVIPRKDLPRIYTMCIPSSERQERIESNDSFRGALVELDSTRHAVVGEVMRAPERRVDNVITRLYDSARLLQMYALILEAVRAHYSRERFNRRLLVSGTVCSGGVLAATAFSFGLSIQVPIGMVAIMLLGAGGLQYQSNQLLQNLSQTLRSEAGLNDFFRLEYGRELADGDEFVLSLWKRVLPQLQLSLRTLGLDNLPKVQSNDLKMIQDLVENEIPKLRREAAPTEKSYAHQVADLFRKS